MREGGRDTERGFPLGNGKEKFSWKREEEIMF